LYFFPFYFPFYGKYELYLSDFTVKSPVFSYFYEFLPKIESVCGDKFMTVAYFSTIHCSLFTSDFSTLETFSCS